MKCAMCDNKKDLKFAKITHKYKECGMENITLKGVNYARCEQCGEEYYNYGDLDDLHAKIAKEIITKATPLSPQEFRFLRLRLGISAAKFAAEIDYTAETIYRYESGDAPIPKSIDKLIRTFVAIGLPDRNYDYHDAILKESGRKTDSLKLTQKGGAWVVENVA